jgi:NTE family protein
LLLKGSHKIKIFSGKKEMNPITFIYKLIRFLIKLVFKFLALGLMIIGVIAIIISAIYYIDPDSIPLLKAKQFVIEQVIQELEDSSQGKGKINININIDDKGKNRDKVNDRRIFPEYLKRGENTNEKKRIIVENPNSLIFSGGGPRGVAYVGVLKYLQEHNKLKNIKRFIGTSAGSIMCTFTSIGTYYEQNRDSQSETFSELISELMMDADYINFIDNPILKKTLRNIKTKSVKLNFQDLFECFNSITGNYALCKGSVILKFFKSSLKKIGLDENITLEELHDKTGKHLILVACSLSYRKTAYFDYITAPNLSVAEAMRASMAVPFIFEPVKYNDDYFIDGGAANNYPINYFDYTEENNLEESVSCLGFILSSKKKILRPEWVSVEDLGNYTASVFNLFMINTNSALYKKNIDRTIFIDCGEINTTSFDINNEQKTELIQAGYNAIEKYYQQ